MLYNKFREGAQSTVLFNNKLLRNYNASSNGVVMGLPGLRAFNERDKNFQSMQFVPHSSVITSHCSVKTFIEVDVSDIYPNVLNVLVHLP